MFEKPFRLHFSSIFEDFFKGFWVILIILITNVAQSINQLKLEEISGKDVLISSMILLSVIVVTLLIIFLRWRKTYITLNSETLVIEKLLINKKITTIGLKNISNVDFEQNLFEKIIGTAKLKLDTNSLSTANQNDVKIILKLDMIKELKRQILLHIDKNSTGTIEKSGTSSENSNINSKKISSEDLADNTDFNIKYDFDRVFQHTLLSIPIFSILLIIGMAIFLAITIQNPEMSKEFFSNFLGSALAIFIVVVPIIYSSVRNIFRLYDFKAKRVNDKIYISYGLFTTRKFTIPVDKINAVIVKQPTLARIFNRYTVEIVNVGMVDNTNEIPVLLLMCTKQELKEKLGILLPELDINVKQESQPKESIIPITIQFFIWSLFLILPTLIFMKSVMYLQLITLAVIILFIVVSIGLAYKTRKLGVNEDSVYITKGIFIRSTVIIKLKKIQFVEVNNSILTKRLGIQKLKIHILAAAANVEHHTGYFKNNILNKILEKYK